MNMKKARPLLMLCACGAVLSGCVAIPCGKQTFTTEYPADIRATDEKPAKEYEPFVFVETAQGRGVDIGLVGDITETQQRVQHYQSVSLDKKRWIAFGVFPDGAEFICRPKGALEQIRDTYIGNGRYSMKGDDPDDTENRHGKEFGWNFGWVLCSGSAGLLGTPFALIWGIFGPFEHDWHYVGPILEQKPQPGGMVYIRDSRPIDLLLKFSPEDRDRIGAWTWHEDNIHPQNTFWHAFTILQWAGISKFCTYVVRDPVETDRTTPVEPGVSRLRLAAQGPYGVFLQIPELGYAEMQEIPRGESCARFDLGAVANGQESARGLVRFLPPSGGMEEARDEDVRAMLELLQGQDLPVTVELPPPRLE